MLDLSVIGIAVETSGLEKGTAALKNTEQAANRTADAADRLGAKTGTLGQKAIATGGDFSRMNSELEKINATFGRFGSMIAGVVSVSAIVIAAKEASALALQMERYANTLKFASGSNQAFAANTEFLRTTVRALGLDLQSASQQFASLTAAARGTALEGSGVRSIFDAVAKASTTMGLTADQTSGSLLAIQQMISKGTVSAEELRGQLGERLPGAFQTAARAMNVTTAELGKMLEQGALATDVFLPRFAAQMRLDMAGSVADAADSVQANLNRVKSDWAILVSTVNNSAFSNETLKGLDQFLTSLTSVLKKSGEDFKGWGDAVADVLAFVGDGLASVMRIVGFFGAGFSATLNIAKLHIEKMKALTALQYDYSAEGRAQALAIQSKYDAETKAIKAGVSKSEEALLTGGSRIRDALAKQRADLAADAPLARINQERKDDAQRAADIALLATTPVLGGKTKKEGGASAYDSLANAIQQQLSLANEELAMGEKLNAADKMREQSISKISAAYADGKISFSEWNALYEKAIVASDARALADNNAAYLKNIEAIKQSNAEMENEIETGQRLTAAQKNALKILTEITNGTRKYTEVQTIATSVELERSIALETASIRRQKDIARIQDEYQQQIKTQDELLASERQIQDARNQGIKAIQDYGKELDEQNKLTELELSLSGKTQTARDIAIGQYKVELELKKQLLAIDQNSGFDEADRIEQRAKAQANAAKAMAGVASRVYADEWKKTTESINSTLTDALMRGFESGKGFAETFRDTVVNMFKTMVLRPVISAIMNPIAQGITGALGLSGAANASQGGGLSSLFSGASSLANIGSTIGSSITGTIANLLPASLSASLGMTSTALATSNAALIGGGSSAALAANTAALAGNATALGGVGSAMAAIPGWGWAAMGAMALLSMGGSKFKSSWSTGNTQVNSDASGNTLAQFSNQEGRAMSADSDKSALGLRATYLSTAKALGIGTRATEFSYAGNSGKEGESPNFALSGGVVGLGGYTQGETKITDESVKLAASKAIFATLQNSDLPKYLKGIFDGMDAGGMSQQQIDGVLTSAAAFKGLHDSLMALPFAKLRDLSYDTASALVKASGGMDAFKTNLATYYDKFYTNTEKAANATASVARVFADIGVAMPALDASAHSAFRALVDGQDLSTASGQKTYAALLGVSGAFDQLSVSADSSANALASVIGGIQSMVDGVHKSVSDSIFAMQYGQEDNAGKYRMLDVKAAATNDQLMASTDIAQISKLANDQIALLNQAFALLDPEQQRNTTVAFEDKLNSIDEFVTSKGADAISVAKANAAETAATIAAAVKIAVAEAMVASSAAITAAATSIEVAAAIPAVANINVSVTKSPGVEVAINEFNRF